MSDEVKEKRLAALAKAREAKVAKKALHDEAMKLARVEAPKVTPKDYDEITYVPDRESPTWTEVHGIEFHANKPVRVPRTKTGLLLLREERTMNDGSIVTRAIEKRVPVVDILRPNPFFSINGAPPAERVVATAKLPHDPDSYRGYATKWIAESTDAAAMDARWKGEDNLRNICGVSASDLDHINPFYEARKALCKGATMRVA